MLGLVVLLDPSLADDLLHRAHLLLERSWLLLGFQLAVSLWLGRVLEGGVVIV